MQSRIERGRGTGASSRTSASACVTRLRERPLGLLARLLTAVEEREAVDELRGEGRAWRSTTRSSPASAPSVGPPPARKVTSRISPSTEGATARVGPAEPPWTLSGKQTP